MTRPNWEEYAIRLAEVASLRSEDPYLQVGACILRTDHSVAALGYNGAPSGITIDWHDRLQRRPLIIHAETNALRWVKPSEGLLLAVTHQPCVRCTTQTAAYGIKTIIFKELLPEDSHYDDSIPIAKQLDIEMRQYSE